MFQDIDPQRIVYAPDRDAPREDDYVLFTRDSRVLLQIEDGSLVLPTFGEMRPALQDKTDGLVYLFSLDDRAFFLSLDQTDEARDYRYRNIYSVRSVRPAGLAFACATAFHVGRWYGHNRYCGQCSGVLERRRGERAVQCPQCGVVEYPAVAPVVIVGVRDGEDILLTKYAGRDYKNYALIAGFVEPGETLEGAIAREVMEEVGLEVANVRYYKSQPWAFSQSILMGFFADLQGARTVALDSDELSEAVWVARSELPAEESRMSLTWDMIAAFRKREI
ncbi:NAD(+) diphosphatase [Fundidesulfovibrio butyratiphilus]